MNAPDLLLQQLVPKSYLVLQKAIKVKVTELTANSRPPFQEKDEFLYVCCVLYSDIVIDSVFFNSKCFLSLMEDKEELNEAVQFLHSES